MPLFVNYFTFYLSSLQNKDFALITEDISKFTVNTLGKFTKSMKPILELFKLFLIEYRKVKEVVVDKDDNSMIPNTNLTRVHSYLYKGLCRRCFHNQFDQQDAHEFLTAFLNFLDEDIIEVSYKNLYFNYLNS